VQLPALAEPEAVCTLRWTRDGEVISERTTLLDAAEEEPDVHELELVPGAYEVEVRLPGGGSATTSFLVTESPLSDEVFRLAAPP
jgi:hypothetical protein